MAEQAAGVPLGLSLHAGSARTKEAVAACQHVFLSPVFAVSKAPAQPCLGVNGFREWAARLSVRAYALGGILEDEAGQLLRAGVHDLAGIRLFFGSPDPQEILSRIAGFAS